jgi:hypothetical protein
MVDDRSTRYRRLLGLGPGATLDDLRRSYRRAMRAAHPDRVGGDGERAREINAARDFLAAEIRSAERLGSKSAPTPTIRPPSYIVIPTSSRGARMPASYESASIRGSAHRPPWASGGIGLGWVAIAILVWLGLLVFATIGWVATEIAPRVAGVLGS